VNAIGTQKEKVYSRYVSKKGAREKVTRWADFLHTMMSPEGKPEALEGMLVLDLSYANFSGIIAGTFFGEAGAEVIRVEPPQGDPARVMSPYGANREGVGTNYLMESRNKRHITLDLETESGRQNLKILASKADILIETYAPGQMDELGLGYRQLRELNPALVYTAITPYGHYGGKSGGLDRIPWSDITCQAESGLAALIGDLPDAPEPYNWPTRAGFYAAGYATAVEAATGALVAHFFRQKTGQGQMVDVAAADAYSSCVGVPPTIGGIWKKPRIRYGTLDYGLSPYGFFKCKDGYVAVACFRDQDFRAALKILGKWKIEEDWRSILDRITDDFDRVKELNDEVAEATAKFTYAEIRQKFSDYAVKAARSKWRGGGMPVTTKMLSPEETSQLAHWKERSSFYQAGHANYGVFTLPVAGKMSQTPLRVKWVSLAVGEDNALIYEKYGLKKEE